jgi:predicted transcriptional regulator
MSKSEEIKLKVLKILEENYPSDFSIGEIAKKANISRPTASLWLKILSAENKIEVSRKVGNAIFYKAKRKVHG